MDAFAVALGVIALAELADKSQLATMAFATRYPARTVLVAISIAALLINGASVLVGSAIATSVPSAAIKVVAGLLFLAFAAWTLRPEPDHRTAAELGSEGSDRPRTGRWAIASIATAFIVAELGDKTMLATATLAATSAPIPTWLGATAGEVLADSLAIVVGAALGSRLPERAIRLAAALAFVLFGLLFVAEGLGLGLR